LYILLTSTIVFPAKGRTAEAATPILFNNTLPVSESFFSCHNRCSFLFH